MNCFFFLLLKKEDISPFCGATDTLYHDAAHSVKPGRQTLYRLNYGGSAYFMSFIQMLSICQSWCFYRPQGKVMFSETFVCPRGGGCRADLPPPGGRPPWYWHLVAATAAVGTYPTGIHFCWKIFQLDTDMLLSDRCQFPHSSLNYNGKKEIHVHDHDLRSTVCPIKLSTLNRTLCWKIASKTLFAGASLYFSI